MHYSADTLTKLIMTFIKCHQAEDVNEEDSQFLKDIGFSPNLVSSLVKPQEL